MPVRKKGNPILNPAEPSAVPAVATPTETSSEDQVYLRIIGKVDQWKLAVNEVRVTNVNEFVQVAGFLIEVANESAFARTYLKDDIKRAFDTHRGLTAKRKKLTDALKQIREVLEDRMRTWRLAMERARIQGQATMAQSAESVREKLLAEAAACDAKAMELKTQMKMSAARNEQARAEELRTQASTMTEVALPDSVPEIEGLKESWPWIGEVVDTHEVVLAVAKGEIPLMHEVVIKGKLQKRSILTVDETVVRALAKQNERDFNIPGCTASQRVSFAAKGAGSEEEEDA